MEEKEEGLSLGEIIHVIFKRKWLFLAVSVGVMVLGFIFVFAVYNPLSECYACEFEIKFPNYQSKLYPDGKEVIYENFINLEQLQLAKSADERFNSIDVEDMSSDNNIVIEEVFTKINNTDYRTNKFMIVAAKKYFSSKRQATLFFRELTSLPMKYAVEKKSEIDYSYNLEQSTSAGTYQTQIDYLIAQRDMIINGYDAMIQSSTSAYSVNISPTETKTLNQAKSEIQNYFEVNSLASLKLAVEQNGYVKKDSDYILNIKRDIERLTREKNKNLIEIETQKQLFTSFTNEFKNASATEYSETLKGIVDKISALSSRNNEIDYQINVVYKEYLDFDASHTENPELVDFDKTLAEYKQKLYDFTNIYKIFVDENYKGNASIVYSYGSIIVKDGGINSILAIAVSLVGGLLVACVINLVIDMPKYLKSKKQNEEEELPAETSDEANKKEE